ncbi:MAG: hypothetical protein IBX70_12190 [Clostridia bacterium]|nr:hypothetical protein [Clostridia bacterium]
MKIFLVIQGVIYMVIVSSDVWYYLSADWSNGIKLFSVFVCFMYLLLTFNRKSSGFDHLLMIGVIAVTFLADAILLFTDLLSVGVVVFILVQILYAYRITLFGQFRSHYRICIGATMTIVLSSLLIWDGTVIIMAVLLYGVLFLMNLWNLIIFQTKEWRSLMLFKIGFVFFLICDINVLLFNILPNYGISNLFYEFTRVSMWFFYLPAQVLLSLSAVIENPKLRLR